MIPVGTSVNPGELRSGPKWEKTFISYPQPPTLSLESTFGKRRTFETTSVSLAFNTKLQFGQLFLLFLNSFVQITSIKM